MVDYFIQLRETFLAHEHATTFCKACDKFAEHWKDYAFRSTLRDLAREFLNVHRKSPRLVGVYVPGINYFHDVLVYIPSLHCSHEQARSIRLLLLDFIIEHPITCSLSIPDSPSNTSIYPTQLNAIPTPETSSSAPA